MITYQCHSLCCRVSIKIAKGRSRAWVVTINGVEYTTDALTKKLGISLSSIHKRVKQHECLAQPKRQRAGRCSKPKAERAVQPILIHPTIRLLSTMKRPPIMMEEG